VNELKEIIDIAKKLMLRDGYHAPMVFAKGTKCNVIVALEIFGNTAEERVEDMVNAGAMLADKRNVGELEQIVLVNEAWIGKNLDVMPSQDPNRIEVLTINSLDTSTQDENLTLFEVMRNPKGQVTDLKQVVLPENGSVKGKLLTAFQNGYLIEIPVLN